MLSAPPIGSSFDKDGVANLPWKDWAMAAYRQAKKYVGTGTTAQRPLNGIEKGDWYFDTTINQPIWYDGSVWLQFTQSATSAEIKTATVTNKYIAPADLLSAQGFTAYYYSGNQTLSVAGSLTLAHGLGREPKLVITKLKCLTAEGGYSIGDVVLVPFYFYTSQVRGASYTVNSTNINVKMSNFTSFHDIVNKSTGAIFTITNANWALIVEAWG